MNVRPLEANDPALADVERLLDAHHGRKLASFGVDEAGHALVMGGFLEDRLCGFGFFRSYRDPRLHVGSQVDLRRIRDIVEMPEVALYQIALVHAEESLVELADAATALIGAFERWLDERFERRCLFITLLGRGNKQARPLYRRLGFKKAGTSTLMRFDLSRLRWVLDRIQPLPEELEPCFFDAATDAQRVDFAECYRQVFLSRDPLPGADVDRALADITNTPEFSERLSLLLVRRSDGRVVGFMLADRPESTRMHVGVAGLLPEVRGQRLPYRCLPPIAHRALELGIDHATFVTTQRRVARLTLRAFGAREMDQLQSYFKVG